MSHRTIRVTLPSRHPGQIAVAESAKRFNCLNCGRRWGKTVFGIDRAIAPEVLRYPVGWFSPTYKMLLDVWREAERITAPITRRKSVQDHRLEFITGGILEFWSLDNDDAARGRKYRRVLIDEAAMVRRLMDVWNFVIRSTLADYGGDAFFMSTPKGRNGFYNLWTLGQDPNSAEWMSWQMPTTVNPYIRPSEVEAMRTTMPERVYRQEILAEFLDDAGGVFRNVTACVAPDLVGPVDGHSYVIGVDWGKLNDFTVLSVLDANDRALVYVDRFNQIDYTVQMGRLRVLCKHFGPVAVVVERNSIGEPLIEALVRMGLPIVAFQTTNASKTAIIDALALAFERADIKIPDNPVLINELQAYEMERLPSGLLRYSAPEGLHDDCVMSLALAWSELVTPETGGLMVYDDALSISQF